MKPISVVISSLRPDELELTIDSTAMHRGLIEVVVVSPYPPKVRDFVKHIPVPLPLEGDPIERDRKGEPSLSKKINLGLSATEGEYIVFNNDTLHFRPGWALVLLEHMKKNINNERPYLARFHLAENGVTGPCYTIFGMLYANLGCIRKADLEYIGGYLYDERMRTEYVDPDLSLRVWSVGGKVGTCQEVVLDVDPYIRVKKSSPDTLCQSYKMTWRASDSAAFFDIWFWKYFWLFFKNYRVISKKLTNADNVLPKNLQNSGAFRIFSEPLLRLFIHTLLRRKKNVIVIKQVLVRLVNRRWATLDYDLPYRHQEVVFKRS